MRAVEARITGRVQGVFFRAYAVREATRLGLGGWVRNDPDGSVTAHVEGDDHAVAEMLEWLWEGSPSARISAVEVHDVAATGAVSFEVED